MTHYLDPARARLFYAQAWATMFYVLTADADARRRLPAYLEALPGERGGDRRRPRSWSGIRPPTRTRRSRGSCWPGCASRMGDPAARGGGSGGNVGPADRLGRIRGAPGRIAAAARQPRHAGPRAVPLGAGGVAVRRPRAGGRGAGGAAVGRPAVRGGRCWTTRHSRGTCDPRTAVQLAAAAAAVAARAGTGVRVGGVAGAATGAGTRPVRFGAGRAVLLAGGDARPRAGDARVAAALPGVARRGLARARDGAVQSGARGRRGAGARDPGTRRRGATLLGRRRAQPAAGAGAHPDPRTPGSRSGDGGLEGEESGLPGRR